MLRASFMPCTFVPFLMLRALIRATRSSMPTWSMVGEVRGSGTRKAAGVLIVAIPPNVKRRVQSALALYSPFCRMYWATSEWMRSSSGFQLRSRTRIPVLETSMSGASCTTVTDGW